MLTGIVDSVKPVYLELAPEIEVDSAEFVQENICFLQSFECCSSKCQKEELISVLEQRDEMTHAKWICKNNQYQKM